MTHAETQCLKFANQVRHKTELRELDELVADRSAHPVIATIEHGNNGVAARIERYGQDVFVIVKRGGEERAYRVLPSVAVAINTIQKGQHE